MRIYAHIFPDAIYWTQHPVARVLPLKMCLELIEETEKEKMTVKETTYTVPRTLEWETLMVVD